jgi:hypothetical protein
MGCFLKGNEMIYEILDTQGNIENTIVADEQFMLDHYPEGNYRQAPDTPVQVPAQPWEWLIDIGSFFDRFGAAKMAVLTSSDAGVQAILKDTQVRQWIDLKHPDVASSIAYIGTKVPALTAKLQSAIFNTPVAETENLALRKLYFS